MGEIGGDEFKKLEEDLGALEIKMQSFGEDFASKDALKEIHDKIVLDFSDQ